MTAIEIARAANARNVVLFHHAPERTDAEVDAILADTRATAAKSTSARKLDVVAAYEGLELELG